MVLVGDPNQRGTSVTKTWRGVSNVVAEGAGLLAPSFRSCCPRTYAAPYVAAAPLVVGIGAKTRTRSFTRSVTKSASPFDATPCGELNAVGDSALVGSIAANMGVDLKSKSEHHPNAGIALLPGRR